MHSPHHVQDGINMHSMSALDVLVWASTSVVLICVIVCLMIIICKYRAANDRLLFRLQRTKTVVVIDLDVLLSSMQHLKEGECLVLPRIKLNTTTETQHDVDLKTLLTRSGRILEN